MLKSQITIGSTYAAKISGRIVPVTITSEHSMYGGWNATNRLTNRQVRIKSAAKLRYQMFTGREQANETISTQ